MRIYALLIVKKLVITLDKNRLTQILLAVFVALIFISSYVSLTNYNTQQTTVSTSPPTYFAQGFAKAKVAGYGNSMSINFTCKNQTIESGASNVITANLTKLYDNNSIFNFYSAGSSIPIEPGNMSAYAIYSFIKGKLTAQEVNCTSSSAVTILQLPAIVNVSVGTQTNQSHIPAGSINQSLQLPLNYTTGSIVRVKFSTTVTSNWTIYGPINLVVLK